MIDHDRQPLPPSQARIVLGGGIDANGKLSETSISRITCAIERHNQVPLPLVLSGRWSLLSESAPKLTEAEAMRSYAVQAGVPASEILLEDNSMETIGNAYYSCINFIRPRKWQNIEIITSAFHSLRTRYSFEKVLGDSCSFHIIEVPGSLLTPQEAQQLKIREQRVTRFIQKLLDPITDGNVNAIEAVLHQLPGYSTQPTYTREDLLKIVSGDVHLGGTYT